MITRVKLGFILRRISEMYFIILIIFKNEVENESNANIKVLSTDGGGEYFSHEFSHYLYNCGIWR